jgi:uncharacterized protein (TIGR03545 family)
MTLIWSAFAFGMDPWLRHTVIQTAQSATGAKADISSFKTGLFPPLLHVSNVALASASSPGTNLVEFDELQCRLGGNPLLRKSFVIEEARLTGVRFGTVRNDDGQLELHPAPEPQAPSWLTEKLSEVGDEWLEELIVDVREQLDPNTLETWRTGQELSEKWEQRMESLQQELKLLKPRVDLLEKRLDDAKQLRSVARVQQYLQLATDGEQLLREVNKLQSRIQGLVPEGQSDLKLLDQARQNDQQQIVRKIHQLRPNPRRITESFIGPEMYRQLHQALSWLQLGSNYHQEIRRQAEVVRHRGHDVEFPILNPTPRFLCRRMELSGELSIDQQLMPFHAVLSDVSSDPMLLGEPAVFRLSIAGEQPLRIAIRHDAATGIPQTDVIAELHQSEHRQLSVGNAKTAVFEAGLANSRWAARIRLSENNVNGTISLESDFVKASVTSQKMNPLMQSAVADVFRGVQSIDATIQIDGTVDAPELGIQSRFGDSIAAGLQTAFAHQAERMKAELTNRLAQMATEQKQRLSKELNSRYQELVADHSRTLQQVKQTQQLLASVRSGQADPRQLFRQVSESGILPNGKQEKVQRQLDQADKLLKGLGSGVFR